MRKKPMQNNYGGHRKNRYGGGGGGSHHNNGNNRPRKNYSANREKYLNQARDALASGDRVMAEYFYQHADHCWRMMMEEGQNRPQPQRQNNPAQPQGEEASAAQEADDQVGNNSQLPAFLTGGYGQPQAAEGAEPPPAQNWEERDA